MIVTGYTINPSFSLLCWASLLLLSSTIALSSAPHFVKCPHPNRSMLRSSVSTDSKQTLCREETRYITSRRAKVGRPAYANFLKNVEGSLGTHPTSITLPNYLIEILGGRKPELLPRTGFAVSGGSLRATLFSLGVLSAFEAENPSAVEVGTAGLLNAADYLAGLSGGSWTVVALTYGAYNLAMGKDPQALANLLPQFDFFTPGDTIKIEGLSPGEINEKYHTDGFMKMAEKSKAGFPVTIADLWGLFIRFHTLGQTTEHNFYDFTLPHGIEATFSGIRNLAKFKKFQLPLPIITALGMSPGHDQSEKQPSALLPLTSTQYEFTPFETGSWDSNLASFMPTEYLGTRLKAGVPVNPTKCVNQFDQVHYLSGISSNFFPTLNISEQYLFEKSPIKSFVQAINQTFATSQPGISIDTASVPNPFFHSGGTHYADKNSINLRLLDGGLDGAVTPHYPLLVPARQLDVIVGIDAISLDNDNGDNYATGSSLKATFARAALEGGSRFPKVPESSSEYLNLRNHPNFFGCEEPHTSLVVWIPNSAPLDGSRGLTNSSISRVQYPIDEALDIISASSEIAYRGKPEHASGKNFRDPLWPACLACAVVDRSRFRMGEKRDGVCADCFEKYCWKE